MTFLETGQGGYEDVDRDKREGTGRGFKGVWRCLFKLLGKELKKRGH